jgi:hypothetical protein
MVNPVYLLVIPADFIKIRGGIAKTKKGGRPFYLAISSANVQIERTSPFFTYKKNA